MTKNKVLLVLFLFFFLGSLLNFLDYFILGRDYFIFPLAGLLLFGYAAYNQYLIIKGKK